MIIILHYYKDESWRHDVEEVKLACGQAHYSDKAHG